MIEAIPHEIHFGWKNDDLVLVRNYRFSDTPRIGDVVEMVPGNAVRIDFVSWRATINGELRPVLGSSVREMPISYYEECGYKRKGS